MSSVPHAGRRRRLIGADLVTTLLGPGHHLTARRAALVALSLATVAAVSIWGSSSLATGAFSAGVGDGAGRLILGDSSCGPVSVPKVRFARHRVKSSSLAGPSRVPYMLPCSHTRTVSF